MVEFPLIGFAPDMPQDTPGVVTQSSAILPTMKGVGNGVGIVVAQPGAPATGSPCGGGYVQTINTTSPRAFIGTPTRIYELDFTPAAVDVSGKAYSASSAAPWSFAQFGGTSLAINVNDVLQASSGASSPFSDVSGAPKGSIVIVAGPPNLSFAMIFDYDDGTRTQDGIFWSASDDYTDWTPAIATGCGNIRLTDINGRITAAIPYRDGVVAFKERAMYLGTYVGAPELWDWHRVSSDIGCIGKNAVCEINERIYFADANGLWVFDGSYPQPVPGALHQWWADQVSGGSFGLADFARMTWDKANGHLWIGFGFLGTSSLAAPSYVVFNVRSQRWTFYGPLQSADGSLTVGELYAPEHAATLVDGQATTNFASMSRRSNQLPAAALRLAALGKTFGTTTFRQMRPQFEVGPSDIASGWLFGSLYSGPSMRNMVMPSDTLAFVAPGQLQAMREARFVAPQIGVAAGNPWELSRIAVDTTYNASGE